MRYLFLILLGLFAVANSYAAEARIDKTWLEHGVTHNGEKGMMVHTAFTIWNQKDKKAKIYVFIKDANGNFVADTNGKYCTVDGNICFYSSFVPSYESSEYSDYKVFVPYSEMHLPAGKHSYTAISYINDMKDYIANGKGVKFDGTGSSRNNNAAPRQNQNNAISNQRKNAAEQVTWRQNYPNGGYCDYVLNPDGSGSSTSVMPCIWCHGAKSCSICAGMGGVYGRAYGGMWYPCKSCAGTGVCQYCHGNGFSTLVTQIRNGVGIGYDQNGNVYLGGGGGYGGSDDNSSKGSSRSNNDYIDTIEYAPNYTGEDNSRYCKQCDSWGPAHVHIRKR